MSSEQMTRTKAGTSARTRDYTVAFTVDQTPQDVFDAVNNVRGWWSETIDGPTDRRGAAFTFRHKDVHRSTQTITDFVPGRRVVWEVRDSHINFVADTSEWDGTEIVFEIVPKGRQTELRFTHVGLVPAVECYDGCSGAWGFYVGESLRSLITTGRGDPAKG